MKKPSITGKIVLGGIHLYQGARAGYPSPCRFTPSCSTYAAEAVATFGAIRGSWLAVKRLLRCRPFAAYGYDPIPSPNSRSSLS